MLMLRNTKSSQKGFTLVELLIAAGILSILSIVSVRLLWDTLSIRSTQYAIEYSSDDFRKAISTMTLAIQSATTITIPDSATLEISGEPCRTFKYNTTSKSLEQALDDSPTCEPPTSGFTQMTQNEIEITTFDFSPIGERPEIVKIDMEGSFSDSIGTHPFSFYTTVASRITL
ncbi:hypothetical protein A3G65_01305 [Candidatus Roizmanbacteria bacterium RIFCSPLOWO2_12_FULL_37_7b]|nr:MAG: hypothetical protein A3G65_01305 [Candidatus Roizmanbacteria bacterium RIFCSPLOWO2_12_FULL_37_7b]